MATTLSQYQARLARYQTRQDKIYAVYGKGRLAPHPQVRLDSYFAAYGQDAERIQVAHTIYKACVDAGCSHAFAFAAVHHAFFESRWNPEAFHPGGKTAAEKEKRRKQGIAVAIGLFQLTQTGIGKSRKYFLDGKKAGMAHQAEKYPDVYYNAQDAQTNIDAWLSAVMLKYRTVATDHNLTVAQAYDQLFWSPLGAGYRNKTFEAQLKNGD